MDMEDVEPLKIQSSENAEAIGLLRSCETEHAATFCKIGIDIEINSDEESLDLSNRRIQVLSGLDKCCKLKSLILVANFITKIQNLEHLTHLIELELYQNKIKSIQGISPLINLRVLDLSFNQIRKIANIETLVNLEKLYLSSNKISKIENLESLTKLKLLELGSNRVRAIEGLSNLGALEELWLGKNKISNFNIPNLPHLKIISLQSNRLLNCDDSVFFNCPNLIEVYLSSNALKYIPVSISFLKNLNVLDVSSNLISSLEFVDYLNDVEELWMNDNNIEDPQELTRLKKLVKLKTIYLERNPVETNLGPGYRSSLMNIVPWIHQVDARILNTSNSNS